MIPGDLAPRLGEQPGHHPGQQLVVRLERGERRGLRQGSETVLAVGGQRGLVRTPLDQLEHPQAYKVPRPQTADVRLAVSHAAQRDCFVAAERRGWAPGQGRSLG